MLLSENHDWSESVYNELARSVRTALHSLGISAERYIHYSFQNIRRITDSV
jgi:hypothetical protein